MRTLLAGLLCGAGLSVRGLDLVRQEIGVDAARTQFGADGQGVLVAIMDTGLDFRNRDFRHPDGTTRIEYIFDLTDDSGSQLNNPYGMGSIYSRTQIDAAIASGGALTHGGAGGFRDAVGHGTASFGIAAGNGANSLGGKYTGIAPQAGLLVVKLNSHGAAAHGNQPAEPVFFDPARIPVAIDFIRDKAQELGRPCVMLLNIGSIGGPTDGTSELARKINSVVGPGIPGLVFVTGASDDGGRPNRVGGALPANGSAQLKFVKRDASSATLNLWYDPNDRLAVEINTPTGPFSFPFPPAVGDPAADAQYYNYPGALTYFHVSAGANPTRSFYRSVNGRGELTITFLGPAGNYTVTLNSLDGTGTGFDATLSPSSIFLPNSAHFETNSPFLTPGALYDAATAHHNITPNSYVIATNWIDLDGVPRQVFGSENGVGSLWRGSGVGPTFDGRLGIDVSAPGDRVITAYAANSAWAANRWQLVHDGNGFYGMAGAVSAAAPVTVGVIALMLQMNPQLDAAEVKAILQHTARADGFTGAVPNTRWGHGKINAFAAVRRAVELATPVVAFDLNPAHLTNQLAIAGIRLPENIGAIVIPGFVTNITVDGVPSASVAFTVTNDHAALFAQPPIIDSAGRLSFEPAPARTGTAIVSVSAGGASREFSIAVIPYRNALDRFRVLPSVRDPQGYVRLILGLRDGTPATAAHLPGLEVFGADSVATPNWQRLSNPLRLVEDRIELVDPDANRPARFYQVREPDQN